MGKKLEKRGLVKNPTHRGKAGKGCKKRNALSAERGDGSRWVKKLWLS